MKIKKGDKVKILSGKDKGKTGKVTKILPKEEKIVVEGVNVLMRHGKPKRQGQKGQIITLAMPLYASKALVVCPACGRAARSGSRMSGKEKIRVCKKCGAEMKY